MPLAIQKQATATDFIAVSIGGGPQSNILLLSFSRAFPSLSSMRSLEMKPTPWVQPVGGLLRTW